MGKGARKKFAARFRDRQWKSHRAVGGEANWSKTRKKRMKRKPTKKRGKPKKGRKKVNFSRKQKMKTH